MSDDSSKKPEPSSWTFGNSGEPESPLVSVAWIVVPIGILIALLVAFWPG